MKKLTTIIATLVLLIGVGIVWAQQDRIFIHTGGQVHEFATTAVDSIVPVLGTTANLDELRFYKDGNVFETFLVNEVDSIIFYEIEPGLFVINTSDITWAESNIYDIKVDGEIVGQLALEFLNKVPLVTRQTIVAYPMLNGTIDMQNGIVVDNGYKVSWNARATTSDEILAIYEAGETVSTPGTIYFDVENSRLTVVKNPALLQANATLTPHMFRDQRTGAANNMDQTTEDFSYGLVKIGTQFWMRENLRTTRYADGAPIPTDFPIAAETEWATDLFPGCLIGVRGHSGGVTVSHANANSTDPGAVALREKYGILYNWLAMSGQTNPQLGVALLHQDKISPEGFGVPVRSQFTELVNYVYNLNIANTGTPNPIAGATGGRLSGYTEEAFPETDAINTIAASNTRASNLSGFTAIGGVSRSNTATGFNGGTMFLMLDGYAHRPTQATLINQHFMNFFQVGTADLTSHSPGFPAIQSVQRGKFIRLIRDNICAHNFVFAETVAPTCTEQGYALYSCTRCVVDEKRAPFVNATEHTFVFEKKVDPTCLTGGYDLYECSICSATEQRNPVDALGHDYSGDPATCLTAQICARVDCEVVLEPALGHDWGPVIATKDPTCDDTGLGERECNRCPAKDEDIVLSKLTPQNVKNEGAMLRWDAVDLATGYILEIEGDASYTTTTNSFDLYPILVDLGLELDIKVKPVGDEDFFEDNTCWSVVYAYTAPSTVFVVDIEDLEFEDSYVYEIVVDEGGAGEKVVGQLAFEFLNKHIPGEEFAVAERRTVVAYTMLNNGKSNLLNGFVVNNGNFVEWNTNATGATPAHEILTSYTEGEEDIDNPAELFLIEGSPRFSAIEISGIANTVTTTLRPMKLRDERSGPANNMGETTEVEEYGLVKIGIQYWTRENLRTRRYADGTNIPTTTEVIEPWENAMKPAVLLGRRNIANITNFPGGYSSRLEVNNANSDDPAHVALRNRYGAVYTFNAIVGETAVLNTPLTISDKISPEGWKVPMRDQVVMLINYVHNISTAGDNLPTGTGAQQPIAGTGISQGRLSGYTADDYPVFNATTWRATNISGFGLIGNNGRSNSMDGWNSNTRFWVMDYQFRPTQTAINNQHVVVMPQINTADVPGHDPSWRMGPTCFAENIRLIKD